MLLLSVDGHAFRPPGVGQPRAGAGGGLAGRRRADRHRQAPRPAAGSDRRRCPRRRHDLATWPAMAVRTRPSTPTPARTLRGGRTSWIETCRRGLFGENFSTAGVEVTNAVIGERWAIGSAIFEVSCPRIRAVRSSRPGTSLTWCGGSSWRAARAPTCGSARPAWSAPGTASRSSTGRGRRDDSRDVPGVARLSQRDCFRRRSCRPKRTGEPGPGWRSPVMLV